MNTENGNSINSINSGDYRHKIAQNFRKRVVDEIIDEGVSQGMSQEEAEERAFQLEEWGELGKTEDLYIIADNLDSWFAKSDN